MTESEPQNRRLGYARFSTYGQTLGAQLDQLRAAGCSQIYREKVTGARADRCELLKLLKAIGPGDVVTVTRIDRLARSTFDLFAIVKQIVDAKAQFRSLAEPWANTATSTGRLMIAVLGGLANVERDLIRTRTAEGRERAKTRGQHMGRATIRGYRHEQLSASRGFIYMEQVMMQQIGELDPDAIIWRYLTFSKFLSLVRTTALWFSKLQVFEDLFEGTAPEPARGSLKSQHHEMEGWFQQEEQKKQVRRFVEDNEENGRELIVANCWFLGNHESERMWIEYAKDEGVVIQSTAGALARSLVMSHDRFWIGKTSYIDLTCYDGMNAYEANQAHLRAFLKASKYSHENELRVATMNWVAPGCLNPDESPQNEKQRAGLVYSSGRRGIFVRANLSILIRALRVAPSATDHHRNMVDLLRSGAGIPTPALRSELS